MTRPTFAAVALLLMLVAAGCGQSGPLYLPGNPSQVQEPPAEPADEDEKDSDDDTDGGR